ncbi:hypothetical protein [Bradyrhizobium sp.]
MQEADYLSNRQRCRCGTNKWSTNGLAGKYGYAALIEHPVAKQLFVSRPGDYVFRIWLGTTPNLGRTPASWQRVQSDGLEIAIVSSKPLCVPKTLSELMT